MSKEEPLQELLHRFECCMHESDLRKTPAKMDRFLDDRFVEFGCSGRVYDKDSMIAALADETAVEISITDFRTTPLSPEVVLVTYRAAITEVEEGSTTHSLRSSIWKLAGGNWRIVFHQGTVVRSS